MFFEGQKWMTKIGTPMGISVRKWYASFAQRRRTIRATQQPVMDLRIAELRLIESHYLQRSALSQTAFSVD
jgi:hypothetical protein